jgi:hypothetical protein
MPAAPLSRLWLDVAAYIGDGANPTLAFGMAVHLAIYAAQDLSDGPIFPTSHPPKRLAEKLRRGLPLSNEMVEMLGEGRWPLPESAFSIAQLPRAVPLTPVKEGSVAWRLTDEHLSLRKTVPVGEAKFVTDVEIAAGRRPTIRQKVGHIGGRSHVAGVPKGLKLISAVCGLYDGRTRLLPVPIYVDSDIDAEQFIKIAEDSERLQPLVAVAAKRGESHNEWIAEVETYAKEAFLLQQVAAVTARGVRALNDLLGSHGLPDGAIKTYNAGFSVLDLPTAHPLTAWETIQAHERGRAGMLERWRKRLMTRDAWDRATVGLGFSNSSEQGSST